MHLQNKHSDINHRKVSKKCQAWEFTTGRGCCLWITPKPGLLGFEKASESKSTGTKVNFYIQYQQKPGKN
jgi:hypothetical protein